MMQETLGEKLIKGGLVTPKQVEKALARQKLHGGRLGQNLVLLGYLSKGDLDNFFRHRPRLPKNVEETGLSLDFICELALKAIFYQGNFMMHDLSERLKLPLSVIDSVIQQLRQDKFIEVKGGAGYESVTYTFSITTLGRQRALEMLEKNHYVGPAPVTLEEYSNIFEYQTVRNVFISEDEIKKAFSHYVVNERLMNQLGPAVNSGKSMFLYGPPGNGKTVIAETIGALMGDDICIPHAVCVDQEIIRVYDPINHKALEETDEGKPSETRKFRDYDQRWVLCRRPVVLVGGELTLGMLDLDFNTIYKYYEAPFQMKANGGVFVIDDFGRQMVRPRDLLNRWIVPLERRTDFLTLHTGKKFEIPFDQLVVFSTNIEPKELVDEAFLRRIRYKVLINHPSEDEYREIFRRICDNNGIEYKSDIVEHLLRDHYTMTGIKLNACHPRDIIDQIIDISRYRKKEPLLTIDIIDEAWNNYFVEV